MKLKIAILTALGALLIPFVGHALTYSDILNGVSGQASPTSTPPQDPSAVIDNSPEDVTPPAAPSNFKALPLNNQVALSWMNPSDADFVRTAIVRRVGNSTDGTVVYEGTDSSFVDINLTNGTSYTYLAYAFDSVPNYSQPVTATAVPDVSKMQTDTPSSTPPTVPPAIVSGPAVKLINNNGTFYLIINNQLHGITNPGMLTSYGFAFSDAVAPSSADLALPQGSLLTPGEGSLVKSQVDQTVYLISNQQRYAFTSASVFLGLGFKFSMVLVVTNPELQLLAKAAEVSDGASGHLPGTDINEQGTVYYIGSDNQLHGYSSLAVYNSWHLSGDFSGVVPANSADSNLQIGDVVAQRILQ